MYKKNLTKFQLQFQLPRVSTPIPTPTPGVSTPTPTPASLLNINSNSNTRSFNSNSNSGQSPEYQLQLQLRRFQLQFQLRSWSWTQLQLRSWPQPWNLNHVIMAQDVYVGGYQGGWLSALAVFFCVLTHWGRDKMPAMFWLRFLWPLFLRVQLITFQHWFR